MALDLGTLQLKLAADVAGLKRDIEQANGQIEKLGRNSERTRDTLSKMWKASGGSINAAGEQISRMREGLEKMFGNNATAMGQRWGNEIRKAIGLTEDQILGLSQAAKGLQGAFQAASSVMVLALSPVGIAVAGVAAGILGIAAAWGAVKNAMDDAKGSAPTPPAQSQEEPGLFRQIMTQDWLGTAADVWGAPAWMRESWVGNAGESIVSAAKSSMPAVKDLGAQMKDDIIAALKRSASEMGLDKLLRALEKLIEPGKTKEQRLADSRELETARDFAYGFSADQYAGDFKKRLSGMGLERYIPGLAEQRRAAEDRARAFDERIKRDRLWEQAEKDAAEKKMQRVQSAFGGQFFSGKSAGAVVGNIAGSQIVSGSAYLSAAGQGAASGAQASGGNPWATAGGAIMGLMSQSQGFSKMLANIDKGLQPVVDMLGSLAEAIIPLVQTFNGHLKPAASAIAAAITPLSFLFKGLGTVISAVHNALFSFIQGIARLIKEIPGPFLEKQMDQLIGWAEEQKYTIGDSDNKVAAAATNASNALNTLAASAYNMPSGYRISAAEYNATRPYRQSEEDNKNWGTWRNGGIQALGGTHGPTTVINNMTVQANDPIEFQRQLDKIASQDANRSGRSYRGAPPFSGGKR